jgi:hypothetical protein
VVLRDSFPLDELVVLLLSYLTKGDNPFSSAVFGLFNYLATIGLPLNLFEEDKRSLN